MNNEFEDAFNYFSPNSVDLSKARIMTSGHVIEANLPLYNQPIE